MIIQEFTKLVSGYLFHFEKFEYMYVCLPLHSVGGKKTRWSSDNTKGSVLESFQYCQPKLIIALQYDTCR